MADLKHTTKRELRAALHAAQDEITRLAGELTTSQDAGRFLSKELDTVTEGLKQATDQEAAVRSDMAILGTKLAEQDSLISDMKGMLTSLQGQLDEARGILLDFESQGITPDVVGSPVNLSALRRVLDASEADEPVFVLRAADMVAPQVVEWWASEAVKAGVSNHRKLGAALARAAEMRKWQEAHGKRIPN